MNAIRARVPSPAMIVACVSLVVALGGVSYAATVLPKNSVGPTQLKKKAVTATKLRPNAVSAAKVKDGSLLAADFRAGQIPAGPQGLKGDRGIPGLPGLSGLTYVTAASPSTAAGANARATAPCPAGKKPIGGGGLTEENTPILESFPAGNEWSVLVRNDTANPVVLVAYAVCAQVS